MDCSGTEVRVQGKSETGAEVSVAIRPEKIGLVEPGTGFFDARVRTRIFLGTSWAYQMDSDLGAFSVTLQNTGHLVAGEGEAVGISWQADAVRLLSAE